MTRVTPASRVRDAMVRASSEASAGVVFIFQLAAMTIGRLMSAIMPESRVRSPADRPPGARRPARSATAGRLPGTGAGWPIPVPATDPSVIVQGQALHPVQRSLHRRPMQLEALGDLGQRRLGRLAASRRNGPDGRRLLREAAVRVERVDRVQLATGRCDGPLEVGALGVEDAVEVPAEGASHAPGLELQE